MGQDRHILLYPFMLKSGKLQAKIETMDRGMICPSLVFDHLSVQPQTVPLNISTRMGFVVFVSFVSRFSRHLSRGWANMKLHPFLVYVGITPWEWGIGTRKQRI